MKKIVDFNGREQDIAGMQKSLRIDFPSYCQKDISSDGEPFLSNCVIRDNNAQFEIVGNGTLQFPLMIKAKVK